MAMGETADSGGRVLFEWAPAAPDRSLRNYAWLGAMLAVIAAFVASATVIFGPGWIVIGIVGAAAAVGYDEWLRFTRNRFRLTVTEDGALHVETWSGSDRHWLPLMKEVRRTSRAFSANSRQTWSRSTGYRYVLELDQENGPTASVSLPGGERFHGGSGMRLSDEEFEQFSVVVSRWCPVRRA